MNRAQRRKAMKRAGHKPNRSTAIYINSFQLEFESFDTIERMFQQIRNGALAWGADGWEIMGLSGEPLHILSALEGWIKYWQEVAEQTNLKTYDDAPLKKLAKSLQYEKPMNMGEVNAAYEVVRVQRTLYRLLPKTLTTRISKQVSKQIAEENEMRELLKVAA